MFEVLTKIFIKTIIPYLMERDTKTNIKNDFKPELLSPAGSMDAALAAFQYGADAIYLGVKKFSARAEANNFDFAELRDITGYAHSFPNPKKIYVTVNTLIQNQELKDVARTLAQLSIIGIDGVIIQDLGVLRLIKESFPNLAPHASTQMAIHNLEGALYAKELGFKRVVLARELSSNEIKNIVQNSRVEIEVFIHGALCYSYSGLCLFSSHCYGLSGNRGRCIYPCRDLYQVKGTGESYLPFSMKDLALPDFISEYKKCKVASLKIEGRKKSPLYVGAVTDYYRHIIDEDISNEELCAKAEDVKAIFSRPWCEFGVRGKVAGSAVDPNWTGHRGVEIGRVEGVKSIAKNVGASLIFKTTKAIELHDGIQLDLTTQTKPFGFAINSIYVAEQKQKNTKEKSGKSKFQKQPVKQQNEEEWKKVIRAEAGSRVAIELPEHYPHIPLNTTVYCGSSQEVKNKFKIQNVNFRNISAKIPVRFELSLTQKQLSACAVTSLFTVKVEKELSLEPTRKVFEAQSAFEKLGDTSYSFNGFSLHNEDNLFVPVSILNDVRRELVSLLDSEYEKYLDELIQNSIKISERCKDETNNPNSEIKNKEWIMKTDDFELIKSASSLSNLNEVVFEVNPHLSENSLREFLTLGSEVKGKLRLALPLIIRRRDITAIKKIITTLASIGFCNWEIANISHLLILKEAYLSRKKKLDITSSWSCYALNGKAIEELLDLDISKITLSTEDSLDNIKNLAQLFPNKLALIVYQDTPLFTSEACPYAVHYGCKGVENCEFRELNLKSKAGNFNVYSDHCLTSVVNEKPFSLSGLLENFVNDEIAFKVEFIKKKYSSEKLLSIWNNLQRNQVIDQTHKSNFERGLK